MAYPGQDLKYRITTTKQDFMLSEGDFEIVIKNSWDKVVRKVKKGDCFCDSEGQCYFALENMAAGVYTAYFIGGYEDSDYPKQSRVFTDVQTLCVVDECGGKEYQPDANHDVQYEQVWTKNLDDGEYLADRDGNFIFASDGKRISFNDRSSSDGKVRMSMTGDEFLQLIEGREPNSEINTIPELFDAVRGISDDGTIIEEIEEEIDEDTPERVTTDDLANFQI